MNLFKGKIYCMKCGKRYNFKNDHGQYIYICSGYKNYGSNYCHRNVVFEKDLIRIVLQHLNIQGIVDVPLDDLSNYIVLIHASDGSISITYTDETESEWNNSKISF